MSEATWKGHVINALRMSGYSADMIRKVIKNLEKSLVALPDEETEALFAKAKLKGMMTIIEDVLLIVTLHSTTK